MLLPNSLIHILNRMEDKIEPYGIVKSGIFSKVFKKPIDNEIALEASAY